MASNLLVKLVFVLIESLSEILFSLFNLFAQLLDVLCCLCIFNNLGPRPHYMYEVSVVNILAHVSKHR